MRIHQAVVAVLGILFTAPAFAEDTIEIVGGSQDEFDSVAEDLVAIIDYKGVVPAEATGIVGFGVGAIIGHTKVGDETDWQNVTGENIDKLGLAGIGVTKGLPLGIDVGLFFGKLPGTNVKLFGGELRYALLEGGVASPAVALRAAHVKASGIDSFDLSSTSFDVSVSKGFAFFTPYGGVGYVMGDADPNGTVSLDKAEVNETKFTVGARFSLGLFEITPELQRIGDNSLLNLRLGFSFSL